MAETHAPVRELNLYRRYFDLVTAGTKTIEVRVKYPHLADLAAGDTIRFRIKGTDETCEVKVVRVTEYTDFEALLDGEGPSHVNPTAPKAKAVDPVTVRAAPADTPTGLTPLRSEGGHRRYSRYQLRIAARARELVDRGTPIEAACRIVILEDQLEEAQRINAEYRRRAGHEAPDNSVPGAG